MAARYWRIVGIRPRSGTLTLGALELFGATGRVDAGATISSSAAPLFGTLAALSDGDDTTTCSFHSEAAAAPGFAIVWDFGPGAAVDVTQLRIRGGLDATQFLDALEIHSLTAGRWEFEHAVEWLPTPVPGGLLIPFRDYNAVVLAASPIAFWPLDETVGTVAAELVAGRNGVRTAGALISPGLAPGSPAAFDPARSGLISVPSSTAFNLTTFSLEFWLKTTTTENLVILERNGNTGFSVQMSGTISADGMFTNYSLGCAANGSGYSGASQAVNTGQPIYCVVRVHPGGVSFYLDAEERTRSSSNAVPNFGDAPFFIGSRNGVSGMPAGSAIGKVALYDRLLTEAEIKKHFANLGTDYAPKRVRTSFDATGVAAQSDVQPHSTLGTEPIRQARDVEFGGAGRIWGTTKIETSPGNLVPTKSRVSILRGRDKLLAREVWSDPVTGEWEAKGLDTRQDFVVLAQDSAGNYQPVAADKTLPEAP